MNIEALGVIETEIVDDDHFRRSSIVRWSEGWRQLCDTVR